MDSPVAYIEHHKGGDNLVWDDPGWNRTPLYAAPQGKPESSVNSGDESGPPAESAFPCVVVPRKLLERISHWTDAAIDEVDTDVIRGELRAVEIECTRLLRTPER